MIHLIDITAGANRSIALESNSSGGAAFIARYASEDGRTWVTSAYWEDNDILLGASDRLRVVGHTPDGDYLVEVVDES